MRRDCRDSNRLISYLLNETNADADESIINLQSKGDSPSQLPNRKTRLSITGKRKVGW